MSNYELYTKEHLISLCVEKDAKITKLKHRLKVEKNRLESLNVLLNEKTGRIERTEIVEQIPQLENMEIVPVINYDLDFELENAMRENGLSPYEKQVESSPNELIFESESKEHENLENVQESSQNQELNFSETEIQNPIKIKEKKEKKQVELPDVSSMTNEKIIELISNFGIAQLKAFCQQRKYKGFSKCTKKQALLEFIRERLV